MKNELTQYTPFIKEIKELIYRRQYEAMKRVNSELMELYWEIGAEIDRKQREQGWGKSVVEILSKELQKEFPGMQGFSARNLWLMRSFYQEYSTMQFLPPLVAELENAHKNLENAQNTENAILQPMVAELEKRPKSHKDAQNLILQASGAEIPCVVLPPLLAQISWAKNVVIMQKCKDPLERKFYIRMTRKYGWTKDVLINNIENQAFVKYMSNQTNFDTTVSEKYKHQAKLAVKDDYNFDFLEMGIEHSEAELETAVIKNIRAFLLEMGGDFSFIGNQYHLDVADDDYYIDLLLYHRRLRCLIAIDLKIGEFKPEYAGKMQFYLTALDETMKLPEENSSVGIIICKNKNRTKVEYALKSANTPIGVATYSFYENLPEEMRSLLPTPEEISAIVRDIEDIGI